MTSHVLILGADGFIGRHFAFTLRAAGWSVTACARRTDRLARMGFATLQADLNDPATHDRAFWAQHLTGVDHVINAAGLLNGSERVMHAVHSAAPEALYQAMHPDMQAFLLSAVGIETGDTGFARHRRAGEAVARDHGVTILRAGLVLGDTSYGGSSLARALAAIPFVTPVVGDGQQQFNPIHAEDLAKVVGACLRSPPGVGPFEIGGPETVTQTDMLLAIRSWLGLPKTRLLRLPMAMARITGRIGDMLRLGPISQTSVAQLSAGVLARTAPLPGPEPRDFSTFLTARPAGSQDLWHARLYLFRPILRLTLALLWLASGILGLVLPPQSFLPLVQPSVMTDSQLVILARLGGLADLMLAWALLRAWRLRGLWVIQFALIAAYTMVFTLLSPVLWMLPLGGLLKNIPMLVLVAIHGVLEDER